MGKIKLGNPRSVSELSHRPFFYLHCDVKLGKLGMKPDGYMMNELSSSKSVYMQGKKVNQSFAKNIISNGV
jgi:hypothetical protein